MEFTRIKNDTGRILSTESYSEQADIDFNSNDTSTLKNGIYDADKEYYDFSLSQFVDRPVMDLSIPKTSIAADGVDTFVITGLPKGKTEVSIDGPVGGRWAETTKSLSLTVDIQGDYILQLTQFPYITQTVRFYGR